MMEKKSEVQKGMGMRGEVCELPVLTHSIDPEKVILKLLSKILIGISSILQLN